MDETREIEQHIDRTRERLGSHLMELETRLTRRPTGGSTSGASAGFLGAAFAGGAALAMACTRGRRGRFR